MLVRARLHLSLSLCLSTHTLLLCVTEYERVLLLYLHLVFVVLVSNFNYCRLVLFNFPSDGLDSSNLCYLFSGSSCLHLSLCSSTNSGLCPVFLHYYRYFFHQSFLLITYFSIGSVVFRVLISSSKRAIGVWVCVVVAFTSAVFLRRMSVFSLLFVFASFVDFLLFVFFTCLAIVVVVLSSFIFVLIRN